MADGSSIIDIDRGTGLPSFALGVKRCRVLGVDLSLQMLQFAERNIVCDDVGFQHLDATDLVGIKDCSFDYATVLLGGTLTVVLGHVGAITGALYIGTLGALLCYIAGFWVIVTALKSVKSDKDSHSIGDS